MSKKECKIRLLDEVSTIIVNLHGDHLEYLYKKYSVFAPNYFFNPTYKLGKWDGKLHYFQKNGKTFIYLLEEIIPILVKFGYTIVLDDLRKSNVITPEPITDKLFEHILHLDAGEPIILRSYQVEAVNSLIEHGNGIIVASTGSGKTLTCAALCHVYDPYKIKTITIVPSQDLIRQTKTEYINCQLDTGEYSGDHKTLEHQHIVSTWQALKNNLKILEMFQMVIVDECHGVKGKILQEILTEHAFNISYRFGFTGTIPKHESEQLTVHTALGPVRYTTPASELIEDGTLAKIHIDVLQLEEDLKTEYQQFCEEDLPGSKPPTYIQFKDGYLPDFAAEKHYFQHNHTRTEWVADFLLTKQDMKKGNVLCLVDGIAFGRKLASFIPGAIFVNGKDVKNPEKRKEIYDMFKDHNDLIVIATVNIAGTGLNIPRIFNLVIIDMGKSFIRVIQAIGRGLRKAADKDSVSVTDICGDLKYSKKHVRERLNFYNEAKYPHEKHKVDYNKQMMVDNDTL